MIAISDIEDGIVDRLTAKMSGVGKISVQKGFDGFPQPALYVSTEEGQLERVTNTRYKQRVKIYLDVIFKHLGEEKERRRGIYTILQASILTLLAQDLGLDIHPIEPKSWRNVTTTEYSSKGLLAFTIELATSFTITVLNDEQLTDLMEVGLSYYLQDAPDDDIVDAEDTVSLPDLPKI